MNVGKRFSSAEVIGTNCLSLYHQNCVERDEVVNKDKKYIVKGVLNSKGNDINPRRKKNM